MIGRSHRTRRTMTAAVVAAIAVATVAGCARDGRDLRVPAPGATAPTINVVPTAGPTTGPAAFDPGGGTMQLLAAWGDGQPIAVQYTCDGAAASPAVSWDGVPAGTAELALTVVDSNADGYVHWLVSNIDPAVAALGEGELPEGAVQGRTDSGDIGWTPPCPPPGDAAHHYVFTLYALDQHVAVDDTMTPDEVLAAITAHDIGAAFITGTHQRI